MIVDNPSEAEMMKEMLETIRPVLSNIINSINIDE
jgi:hypothetical protein